jgi:hypothetical protein
MAKRADTDAAREARKELDNRRLILDISDRLRKITPEELREMPYDALREIMVFLELDPDEPLPDHILWLIGKVQSEKSVRPELRLVPTGKAMLPGQNRRALKSDVSNLRTVVDLEISGEMTREDELSTLGSLVGRPVLVQDRKLDTDEDTAIWR